MNHQYAWVLEIRPGYEDEYKKRHDEIWPEMLDELKRSGIVNYQIFKYGLVLFGYFETKNLQQTIDYLKESEINAKWGEYMSPIMKIDIDSQTNFPFLLPNQFSFQVKE